MFSKYATFGRIEATPEQIAAYEVEMRRRMGDEQYERALAKQRRHKARLAAETRVESAAMQDYRHSVQTARIEGRHV